MAALVDVYGQFIGSRTWYGLRLDRQILAHALHNYFVDIDRYKQFHNLDATMVDKHKVAAFTIKWIVMCKPIQVEQSQQRTSNKTYWLFANEIFAFHAGMHLMGLATDNITKPFFLAFVYKLHFRPVVAETLLTEMYAIEQACQNRGNI